MTRTVARKHADQLVAAGVDFVFVDATNFQGKQATVLAGQDSAASQAAYMAKQADIMAVRPIEVLFAEWKAYRGEGRPTPRIAVWTWATCQSCGDFTVTSPLWQQFSSGYTALSKDPASNNLIARDPYTGQMLMFVRPLDASASDIQAYVKSLNLSAAQAQSLAASLAESSNQWVIASLLAAGIRPVMIWANFSQQELATAKNGRYRHAYMEPCTTSSANGTTKFTTSVSATQRCQQPFTPAGDLSSISVSSSYGTGYASLFGGASTYASGLTLKRQFETALAIRPDLVLINEWNELGAAPQPNRYKAADDTAYSMGLYGDQGGFGVDGYSLWVDGFTSAYARDLEPTKENGGHPYDILKSCVRVYRSGRKACSATAERCCNLAESDEYTNVYSLRSLSSGEHVLTTSVAERNHLVDSARTYREIASRYGDYTVFARNPDEPETRSGPFILYSRDDASRPRTALYRCRTTTTSKSFFSVSPTCEGQTTVGLLGYMARSPSGTHVRPLRRCFDQTYDGPADQTYGWHMHTTAQDCPAGMSQGSLLGYVR